MTNRSILVNFWPIHLLPVIIATLAILLVGCSNPPTPTTVPTRQLVEPTNPHATPFSPSATASLSPTLTPTPTLVPPLPTSSFTPSTADMLLDAAREEGQLNVIALPRDWMNYGEIIDAFSRKYGIRVNELEPNASSMDELVALRVARKLASEASPDVIDVGLSFAVQAKDEELLQQYKVATWDTIPENMKDPDGFWYGDYYGVIAFEVNADATPDIPSDWGDLLTSGSSIALAGQPLESYQARMSVYAASLANGGSLDDVVPGLRFFQRLNNVGNFNHTSASLETITSGETPIVIRWDYLALADQNDQTGEKTILVIIPDTGRLAGLYAQAISAYAPHPNAARLWMEFLFSDEGQLLWLKGFGHPVRFDDLLARGVVPQDLLHLVPPADSYENVVFPTAEQLNQADKAVLVGWPNFIR